MKRPEIHKGSTLTEDSDLRIDSTKISQNNPVAVDHLNYSSPSPTTSSGVQGFKMADCTGVGYGFAIPVGGLSLFMELLIQPR